MLPAETGQEAWSELPLSFAVMLPIWVQVVDVSEMKTLP